MTRTVRLTTHIDAPPDRVWEEVQTSRLLVHVARGLIRFAPVRGQPFPERWQAREYRAWMWLFGILPIGWQVIGIEFPPSDGAKHYLRDNGRGMTIRRWDHLITIEPEGDGTRYTDEVHIDAGLLTLPVTLFARAFYAHRQKRWRQLATSGFDYGA